MPVMAEFHVNDRVSWETPQGRPHGRIVRRLTSPTQIRGFHVDASEEEPRYLVESVESGDLAAHRPEALRRDDD